MYKMRQNSIWNKPVLITKRHIDTCTVMVPTEHQIVTPFSAIAQRRWEALHKRNGRSLHVTSLQTSRQSEGTQTKALSNPH